MQNRHFRNNIMQYPPYKYNIIYLPFFAIDFAHIGRIYKKEFLSATQGASDAATEGINRVRSFVSAAGKQPFHCIIDYSSD